MSSPLIGDNSGNTENKLAGALHTVKARYNMAAQDRKNAAAVIRDLKADFKAANPEKQELIDKLKAEAREAMADAMRLHPGYIEAEIMKANAAKAMKEAIALGREYGLDMPALRQVLKMAEMDIVEREEYFDAVDMYAKALRLWESYQ